MAALALSSGADLAVVTAGSIGLVLAHGKSIVAVTGQPILNNKAGDSSGAGAAVSVALIDALISDQMGNIEDTAHTLALAGAAQCGISGAMDHHTLPTWQKLLLSSQINQP
jgi:sugar/nucleoside kinase (ribokinase family)